MLSNTDEEECEIAYENPRCPYVTQINLNTGCVKNVEKTLTALMGEDGTALNQGAIHDIMEKLNSLTKTRSITASWLNFWKPILIAVIITALTTYLIVRFG